ncbi:MAG: hypothetical protein DCC49_10605 [Acidobacteria bacterium]|nr:MAG: hypothetical protein DCC49_10605 [Acidobacteriota bacterium]
MRCLNNRLAPAAGLRNVLIHRYTDIRADLVDESAKQILEGFPEYIGQDRDFLRSLPQAKA